MDKETKQRTDSHKHRILMLLRSAGDKGILNTELSKIALRYNARLQELYVEGYKIESQELGGGLTKYILKSEPETKQDKPKSALEIMQADLKDKYNDNISTDELMSYLAEHNFTVKRKIGSFC